MRERGFSLVELVVVLAIMGTLLAIVSLNWHEMQMKSAVESEIKKIHADLMEVRLQALYGKKARSVVISGQQFKVYSSAATGSVPPVVTKTLPYAVEWHGGSPLTFNAQGLTTDVGSLCIVPTNSAAVDSIVVSTARINLGKRQTGEACNSDHIDPK